MGSERKLNCQNVQMVSLPFVAIVVVVVQERKFDWKLKGNENKITEQVMKSQSKLFFSFVPRPVSTSSFQ